MAKQKKDNTEPQSLYFKCKDCAGAELHRWRNDPDIAACLYITNHPRQAANTKHKCSFFAPLPRGRQPVIINHDDG